jgi:hypothetical protein
VRTGIEFSEAPKTALLRPINMDMPKANYENILKPDAEVQLREYSEA